MARLTKAVAREGFPTMEEATSTLSSVADNPRKA
jgi:hypothetical protein